MSGQFHTLVLFYEDYKFLWGNKLHWVRYLEMQFVVPHGPRYFFSNAISHLNSSTNIISLFQMISNVFLSGRYSRVVGEGVQRKTFLGSQEKYQTSNTSKLESMVGRTHGKRKTSSTYILIIVWEFRFVLWFFISFIINFRLEFLGSSLDLQCEEVQKVKEVYRRKLKIRFISL